MGAVLTVQITTLLFTFTVQKYVNFEILKLQVNGPLPKRGGGGVANGSSREGRGGVIDDQSEIDIT